MKNSSWCAVVWPQPPPGCTASSPGGSAKISQPSPASTPGKPSTSRKNARAASASSAKMIVCAPAITTGPFNTSSSLKGRTVVPADNELYNAPGDIWWDESQPLSAIRSALNPGRLLYLRRVLDQLDLNPRGKRILDIGCGGG